MLDVLIMAVTFIGLCIGSYTDLKTREVPDWLNFSLIAYGLGLRLIWSIITSDSSFFIAGVLGFGIFFGLALAMFYTGQWGGGDAKLLMAMGALVGFDFSSASLLLGFIVNLVVVGSLYGLLASAILIYGKGKPFRSAFKKYLAKTKIWHVITLGIVCTCIIVAFLVSDVIVRLLLLALIVVVYSSYYLLAFIKSVEQSCMLLQVSPLALTEGDWIARDIIVKGKTIVGPKDLGISKHQIKLLKNYFAQGKIKKILIKQGIPFVPSFLIAYAATIFWGNILFLLI